MGTKQHSKDRKAPIRATRQPCSTQCAYLLQWDSCDGLLTVARMFQGAWGTLVPRQHERPATSYRHLLAANNQAEKQEAMPEFLPVVRQEPSSRKAIPASVCIFLEQGPLQTGQGRSWDYARRPGEPLQKAAQHKPSYWEV